MLLFGVYCSCLEFDILKDYYKILRVSRLSKAEEIKRSYRRLVSKYHPDINPDPDAHAILIEINEAYGILGDQNLKRFYDQQLQFLQNKGSGHYNVNSEPVDARKTRRGRKETPEEKEQKRVYAINRNKLFNRRLKILSLISFLASIFIFMDYFLPKEKAEVKAYLTFKLSKVNLDNEVYGIFINDERKLNLVATRVNETSPNLNEGYVLISTTPVLGIISDIEIGKFTFKPFESLFDMMLIYGFVCLASMYVLNYKTEENIVLPSIITFFSNMLVVVFFILLLAE